MNELQVVLLKLLTRSLLNIRELCNLGDCVDAQLEAEHTHNIPDLVRTLDERDLDYYLNTERVSYRKQSKKEYGMRFIPIWQELDGLISIYKT